MSEPRKVAPAGLSVLLAVMLAMMAMMACQSNQPTYIVGVIGQSPLLDVVVDGFKSGMAELVYVEGLDVDYIYSGPTDPGDTQAEIERLLASNVSLILALGSRAAIEAKRAVEGTSMPVVFVPVYDPVRSGLVQSLVRPGGNLTGIRTGGRISKILEIYTKINPDIRSIFVPHVAGDDSSVQSLDELESESSAMGLDLLVVEVSTGGELLSALRNVPGDADALFLLTSSLLLRHVDRFVDAAVENRIPIASSSRGASSGLVFGYEMDRHQYGRQVSGYINKIFRGALPSDLPVEAADAFLSVNLATGKAVGVMIPDEILNIAELVLR